LLRRENLLRKGKEEVGIISGNGIDTFHGALNSSEKGMNIDRISNIRK
jgi:hypothetical protein